MSETFYEYGMRLRGFSPGCQPMEGFVLRCLDIPIEYHSKGYHDVLLYNRKLTDKELLDYEMDFLRVVKMY